MITNQRIGVFSLILTTRSVASIAMPLDTSQTIAQYGEELLLYSCKERTTVAKVVNLTVALKVIRYCTRTDFCE